MDPDPLVRGADFHVHILFWGEGFSCSLDVPFGDLGYSISIFDQNNIKFFFQL
jgi:hypothetical protein